MAVFRFLFGCYMVYGCYMRMQSSCSTRMIFPGLSTIGKMGATRNSGSRVQPDLIELTECDIGIRFRQPVTSTHSQHSRSSS